MAPSTPTSPFVIVTPPHRCDPQLAIAAARADAWGILDLAGAEEGQSSIAAIQALAQGTRNRGRWGLRWDSLGRDELPGCLEQNHADRLPTLILAGIDFVANNVANLAQSAKALTQFLIAETTSVADARAAEAAGFDGIVLKGHEAGGRIGAESAYLLAQQARDRLMLPYWIQGGIGPDTAAAVLLSGATGVVLGEQLWLTGESPFSAAERKIWASLDGSETVCIGTDKLAFRFFSRSGRALLLDLEKQQAAGKNWPEALYGLLWREPSHCPDGPVSALVPLGQEIAFAAYLARKYGTVGGILGAFRKSMEANPRLARSQQALAPSSPLARVHGVTYPIVQGPMTRVSDGMPFCAAIANHGGLPFLALALMRGPEVRALLKEVKARLGSQPWGVGILGFVPAELRQEQLVEIRTAHPPFVIIAGGRPSQAAELEQDGISTYLHVPSPGLLEAFLRDGARKIIFEGRECGGHVGPRSSFSLWQSALNILSEVEIPDPHNMQVLFAGGIHDAMSAAMVATTAAPLVDRGFKIGVLMGTAYIFTSEAVACGAITEEFQRQALACTETVLLESGTGHSTRCMKTPIADEFDAQKRALILAGKNEDEIRLELELFNIGRLRIASKGVARKSAPSISASERGALEQVDVATQRRDGLFMIGQLVTMHDRAFPVRELHETVSTGSVEILNQRAEALASTTEKVPNSPGEELAIVGMSCLFPDSPNLAQFWHNILAKFDAVREVPPERWRTEDFFSPDRRAPDQVYSKWGAFLGDIVFDPVKYRIPPASLVSIEPIQLLSLEIAWQALEDAGYHKREFPRERTAVIFGVCGPNDLGMAYAFRTLLRHYLPQVECLTPAARQEVLNGLESKLPRWTEDSFPGFLNNVVAGRISNHLNLNGSNYTVDAACAAALAAVHAASEQLRAHTCDMAIVGAADATNNPCGFMSFAKTHALSPRGKSRPFDDSADGIALGEGVAAIVLKRLRDAERDGDQIYAVLKGIGSASDGRNRSLTAPHPPGQVTALRRAYENAGISPATVGLIEAHGTGTAVGDRAEIEGLQTVFAAENSATQSCAIGSVKSMIGHTKTAAGLAGLIKAALALKHRVLPPTLHVEVPNKQIDFQRSAFYVNCDSRPWLHGDSRLPRRAGVSAFGFGGTNFHVVLEEYSHEYRACAATDLSPRSVELFAWMRTERKELIDTLRQLDQQMAATPVNNLAQLAFSVFNEEKSRIPLPDNAAVYRLAVVAESVSDFQIKLQKTLKDLQDHESIDNPSGVFLTKTLPRTREQVCFLFPGQGSQSPGMLRDLVLASPWCHQLFSTADRLLGDLLPRPLSAYIYPVSVFEEKDRQRVRDELNDTRVAQPALGVMELFALDLLDHFGITPGVVAGHSYGEYVALCAAGVLSRDDLVRLSGERGRIIHEASRPSPGGMAAVAFDAETTQAALLPLKLPVTVANRNAPDQTIIAGPVTAIDDAVAALSRQGLRIQKISATAAFHTAALEGPGRVFGAELSFVSIAEPRIPVFSNTTASAYPSGQEAIRENLVRHMSQPVLFEEEIRALHRLGARIFIEVGPGSVLTGLVKRILAKETHTALTLDASEREGWHQLAILLARCHSQGLALQLDAWFVGRRLTLLGTADFFRSARVAGQRKPTDWLVNGSRANPLAPVPASRESKMTADSAERPKPVPAAQPPLASRIPPVPTQVNGSAKKSNAPAMQRRGSVPSSLKINEQKIMQANSSEHTQTNGVHPPVSEVTPESLTKPANFLIPTPSARTSEDIREGLTQFQTNMGHWLELQKNQQQISERFLEVQERVMMTLLQNPAATQSAANPAPKVVPKPLGMQALRIPPAPVRPTSKIVAARSPAPATPVARTSQPPVSSRVLEKTPDPSMTPPLEKSRPSLDADTLTLDSTHNAAPTTEDFRRDLLQAMSERTGYPVEMLDEDLPLEAGLGIDSIKRVEIFSSLKTYYCFLQQKERDEEEILTAFTKWKTIRDMVDGYDRERKEILEGGVNGLKASLTLEPREKTSAPNPLSISSSHLSVSKLAEMPPGPFPETRRYAVRAVPAPALSVRAPGNETLPPNQVLLVLGEISELRAVMETTLTTGDTRICQVLPGDDTRQISAGLYQANFSSPAEVAKLNRLIAANKKGVVGGIINLLGLHDRFRQSTSASHALELAQSLFNVLKEFEADLKRSSEWGGGRLYNFTALGGTFGLTGTQPLPLAQAGTLGIFKSIAREWPGIHFRTIDIDPLMEPQSLLPRILAELTAPEGPNEIGLTSEGRWQIDLVEEADNAEVTQPLQLPRDAIVLVTGGADGITAEVVKELARRNPVRFVLVGRSPLPGEESVEYRDLRDEQSLRNHLIGSSRLNGATSPAAIEQSVQRILKDRRIRGNLAELRELGATVEYHALDVRDVEKFGGLIDALQAKWGHIDGVIHGAGVVEDKLVRDKTPESFSNVFTTKAQSAQILADKLRPDGLRFLVFFSSVAGRFGNAGQADYSAANEFLNKMAQHLNRQWPGRIVAINWGPWASKGGMVSEELGKLFAARNVGLIRPEDGARWFLSELQISKKTHAEVVIAAGMQGMR